MILTREDANDLLVACGYFSCRIWKEDRVVRKLNSLDLLPIPSRLQGDDDSEDVCKILLELCLASLAQGNPIKVGEITAEDNPDARRLSEPHRYRRSPGSLPNTQSLEAMYIKDKRSRRWHAGAIMAQYCDENGYPQLPTDDAVIIQAIDDAYVDNGGEPNMRESKYAWYQAKAVLHGYFSSLPNKEPSDEH